MLLKRKVFTSWDKSRTTKTNPPHKLPAWRYALEFPGRGERLDLCGKFIVFAIHSWHSVLEAGALLWPACPSQIHSPHAGSSGAPQVPAAALREAQAVL